MAVTMALVKLFQISPKKDLKIIFKLENLVKCQLCMRWPGSGVLLMILSYLLPPIIPYLPLSTLSAILLSYIIFTPNIELFVRLWTFDSKKNIVLLEFESLLKLFYR
jgi:hypothetical protein